MSDEISHTATADVDRVRHTEEMDLDLAQNYLDFVQGKQTEETGRESHGRLYDPVHHHKLGTYWSAAKNAHEALARGVTEHAGTDFPKWRPSEQLFRLMKQEMTARGMKAGKPRGMVVRKKAK